MRMTTETLQDDMLMICLDGAFDLMAVDELEPDFRRETSDSHKYIILDVAAVSYITSCGIRLLLSTIKQLHKRGGNLVVLSPNSTVTTVLATSGLNTLVPTAVDMNEALSVAKTPWFMPEDYY